MKETCKKISNILKVVFGYGIMICLFGGGISFFGYLTALIIGGDIAVSICDFIYNQYLPVIIYASTLLVLLGLVSMYLAQESALSSKKKSK